MTEALDGSKLPRSLRWRLQLGLLQYPLDDSSPNVLASLRETNESFLEAQRAEFDELLDQKDELLLKLEGSSEVKNDAPYEHSTPDQMDPLSMMLKQREDMARKQRRSSHTSIAKAQESYRVIRKDLNRLDNDHASYYRSRANWKIHMSASSSGGEEEKDFDAALAERNQLLTSLLQVYANNHSDPGYQQGMHEVASYLMFVYEMDLFDLETSECKDYEGLLESDYLVHDTYWLTDKLLISLECGYGVHDQDLETMGKSILNKLQYVARNKDLYTHLSGMEWSPELYTTGWIRLLFAREVKGWRNVLRLWDIFFDCVTRSTNITSMPLHKYTRPGMETELELGSFELMAVLETCAASHIWLRRKDLMGEKSADEAFQAFCSATNALDDIGPLIATLLSTLRRIQVNDTRAPLLPPSPKMKARPALSFGESISSSFRSLAVTSTRNLDSSPQHSLASHQSSGHSTSLLSESISNSIRNLTASPMTSKATSSNSSLSSLFSRSSSLRLPNTSSTTSTSNEDRPRIQRRGSMGRLMSDTSGQVPPRPTRQRMRRRSSLQHSFTTTPNNLLAPVDEHVEQKPRPQMKRRSSLQLIASQTFDTLVDSSVNSYLKSYAANNSSDDDEISIVNDENNNEDEDDDLDSSLGHEQDGSNPSHVGPGQTYVSSLTANASMKFNMKLLLTTPQSFSDSDDSIDSLFSESPAIDDF